MYKNSDRDALVIGLKRHLLISQDTTVRKQTREDSLNNISEVLEFVVLNINDSLGEEEHMLLHKFFLLLLTKVKEALDCFLSAPISFEEEIGFLSILHEIDKRDK